jgi:uncharacterized protein (TIGR03083 family)
MIARTFVAWVEPKAQELRQGRAEIARTARQLLPEQLSVPSPLEGWTYKDLLAHLASGDWFFQTMLRETLGIEKGLPDEQDMSFVNDGNARMLAERKDRGVEELIAEAESEGEETQELLSQISDATDPSAVVWHRPNGDSVTLQQWLEGFPQHDKGHVAQLRTALDNVMM